MDSWWNIEKYSRFLFKKDNNNVIPYRPKNNIDIETKNNNMWENLKPLDLSKIQIKPFSENRYFKQEYQKTQVVIHHTVSGDGINGDVATWEADPARIATCIIIDRAGVPWQLFSSRFWAYHIGAGNSWLDRHSIGIELDSWGWLIPGDGTSKLFGNPKKSIKTEIGKYYTYYGNSINVPMEYYKDYFRGYNYYEKYTDKQIETLGELLLLWKKRYNISLNYNEDMWDVSKRALSGINGVWGHTSYRPISEKTDPHPQSELINMLKTLEGIA
jgi:N-acetyl-anhydromuramyl-L-alanine amidase AmpD